MHYAYQEEMIKSMLTGIGWLYMMPSTWPWRLYYSALAQLVEQMTVNHWVAGRASRRSQILADNKFCFRDVLLLWGS